MATIHKVNCNLYKKYICHHLLLFMVLSATPACEAYERYNTNKMQVVDNGKASDITDTRQTESKEVSKENTTQTQVYENQYMKFNIPAGWTAKQATHTTYVGSVARKFSNPAAVNVTKGNYILHINARASQASGVMGGRFGEIAGGVPSVDAVVKDIANGDTCGNGESHAVFAKYVRWDFYSSDLGNKELCNLSESGSVWYFSFITTNNGGYFNYYDNNCCGGLVVTMAYNSRDISDLPVKGSATLNRMLNEMTNIVKTLKVKGVSLTSRCDSM
jgi:hypothetical protein